MPSTRYYLTYIALPNIGYYSQYSHGFKMHHPRRHDLLLRIFYLALTLWTLAKCTYNISNISLKDAAAPKILANSHKLVYLKSPTASSIWMLSPSKKLISKKNYQKHATLYSILILLLSGDIELNPGPANSFYPCPLCELYVEYGMKACLLYTSPSPRDGLLSRMPSSA